MLVRRKKQPDNIPTLNERVESEAPATGTPGEQAPETARIASSPDADEARPRPRSAFEVTVEAMVSEILNRHMANAREEITRAVLAEVRARLHGDAQAKARK